MTDTAEPTQLNKALELLNELFEQTDQDCPQDYRTRHLVDTMEEVEQFLVDTNIRKYE
tara:strand:- start:2434 stop:2607 length:174 start_codon:yes stop_codon:yes gene_type:complete